MTKEIVAIWAEDENGIIGSNGTLPWHLPRELQHFKNTTLHHAILMGRVTFEGMERKILPNRQTLVMTRDDQYDVEGVLTVTSLEKALEWFHAQEKNLYVIGGAKVLESFEGHFNRIIKTVVHHQFEGDTYCPNINLDDYIEEDQFFYEKDEQNPFDFTVHVLVKK
ncbi:dihydrofolate reductase [Streptococcus pseudoporcinus]|uniref:Dihydrofolate reductase n=2 Tax=Streptococcus pseudoporcinus TaxID=361101 RepID=A0A4U9XLU2_9STRE|nr:dihydrofolate reductase [Streptococcus pseudoporcinus]EFR44164.1 dihydrofolate reductase [Streptococcus pseudoporcinus SPIN 20026]EHI65890.1 dihydrofolate reductase [Streptococcus pseudoporcinus LQ 940-04]VEF94694.1 dihydrofolate reductase [Streptococcus pseudoporcinus]VTS13999.1 dihydrofolate reductase [Streptococcus pseudoporcinus]VTS22217.1 dihydrofolate reductase [Streptococcus pseudoporcinus]